MIKAITFDIDTTLTFEVSWYVITEKLGADPDQHRAIFTEFLENKIPYTVAKTRLIQLWKKTGKCNKKTFRRIFTDVKLKNDVQEVIDYLQSKGIIICLITGAVDLYAEIISHRLGIEHYYANTKLIWNDKDELVDFEYDINQGIKKLAQFKSFCRDNTLQTEDVYVVGDDENDLELFTYTKHGIAVKSPNSHKVEEHAWKIINNLSELKSLIV